MPKPGDAIIQPGRYDGGKVEDEVAALADFIPIDFGGGGASCDISHKCRENSQFDCSDAWLQP